MEDHFVEVTDMITVGKGAKRPAKTVMMSRYACYLVIQNADPSKEIVAHGQTYFAIQARRQELSDAEIEEQRRLAIRSELRTHNSQLADAAKDAGVIDPRDYAIFLYPMTLTLPCPTPTACRHFLCLGLRRMEQKPLPVRLHPCPPSIHLPASFKSHEPHWIRTLHRR